MPEPNEPYYLGKAIHYWQPDWVEGDFFLDTADAHTVFYFTFGWLALWLGPTALAWTGRAITWSLLAWSWQRLSRTVVPQPGWAVLSAMVLVACLENAHMAGEWMIAGVEGKGFAYVFVLLALADMIRQQSAAARRKYWTRCWVLLGIASALHVLVGGWAVVAVGIAWLLEGRRRACLADLLPGLVTGGLIALLGLLPVVLLNRGTPADTVTWANEIYVYVRLGHHLTLDAIPGWFISRFALLTGLWAVMWWWITYGHKPDATAGPPSSGGPHPNPLPAGEGTGVNPLPAGEGTDNSAGQAPLLNGRSAVHRFVAGAVMIAMVGAVISWWQPGGPAWSAALLRFYWFRLSDVAVPIGVALGTIQLGVIGVAAWTDGALERRRRAYAGLALAALVMVVSATYVITRAGEVTFAQPPRAFRVTRHRGFDERLHDFAAWRDICRRIDRSDQIPRDARFFTPRLAQTFKWYARRPEVVNWKEIPQDAAGIVEWWRRIRKIHAPPDARWPIRWYNSLARQGPRRLRALAERYDADYAVTFVEPPLPLPAVLRNDRYVVYRLSP